MIGNVWYYRIGPEMQRWRFFCLIIHLPSCSFNNLFPVSTNNFIESGIAIESDAKTG
jgi:hypothetical protein